MASIMLTVSYVLLLLMIYGLSRMDGLLVSVQENRVRHSLQNATTLGPAHCRQPVLSLLPKLAVSTSRVSIPVSQSLHDDRHGHTRPPLACARARSRGRGGPPGRTSPPFLAFVEDERAGEKIAGAFYIYQNLDC